MEKKSKAAPGSVGHGTKDVAMESGLTRRDMLVAAAVLGGIPVSTANAANQVYPENQQPGKPRSEWDLTAASTAIEGFATQMSVNRGEIVRFKVKTTAKSYRIDVYRLGYYGGSGARKVATLSPAALPSQPSPLKNTATGLVDAGNWSVSASWSVPPTAVSGVYVAKLVRTDGTSGSNHIVFVVRADGEAADIVFQTSDTTWQAYNAWGGVPGPRISLPVKRLGSEQWLVAQPRLISISASGTMSTCAS